MPAKYLLVFLLACSFPAAAQNDNNIAESIMVTANRIPVPWRRIAGSVSVLDQAGLESHGNLSLVDILRQLPSVSASNSGGAGQPTALRVRGEEGFRTLAIIDGIRLSDPGGTQIGPQLEHLMTNGIGKVELLRGPQGLGYGADAGGILNITTTNVEERLAANLDVQGGRFDTRQIAGNVGGRTDKLDFYAAIADYRTAGFNASDADTVLRDKDGYDNTTIHTRAGLRISDKSSVNFVYRNVDGFTQYDVCGGFDCTSFFAQQSARIGFDYAGDVFSHVISFARTATDRDFHAGNTSVFATRGDLTRLDYVGSARGLTGIDLVYGLDFELATVNGKGRDNTGYFAEVLSDFSDVLFISAGFRHDNNDDFGTNTSLRFSGAWLHDLSGGNTLKFKGGYGTGFRAPAPAELAYNKGPFALPPASVTPLEQETSRGIELGVEYLTAGNLHLEAVWFRQEVADAIDFDLVNFSGYTQLAGTSSSEGVELNGSFTLGNIDLQANYTWNPTARPDGLQRQRRPLQLANLGLTWQASDKLVLNAWYRISQDAVDGSNASFYALDDFAVLDLGARYALTGNLQLYARIENALNEKYQEIATYNTPGAAAFFGFQASFR